MKDRNVLWIVLIFALFCFMGCSTTPSIRSIPYTFAENKSAKGTAKIVIYARLIDVDGEKLPTPEEGTRWYPLQFPAGRSFNIKLHVQHDGWTSTGGYFDIPYFSAFAVIDTEVIFKCPPLEAGEEYTISYEYSILGKKLDLTTQTFFGKVTIYSQWII